MEQQASPAAAARPPVIVLRVTMRAPDLDSFITRYARHIVGDRIFIFSKTPQPVGTRVRFVLQLENGEVLIHGRGTVTRMQVETGNPRRPPGMELVFVPLDERSQTLIDFMMAARAGLTEAVPANESAVAPSPATQPPPLPAEAQPPSPPAPPLPPQSGTKAAAPLRPPSLSLDVGWQDLGPNRSAPPPPPVPASAASPPPTEPERRHSPETAPTAVLDPAILAQKLAELGPLTTETPTVDGPAPVVAEAWRDPNLPEADVPANPFGEVSDGAIEYFVEWSIEQSRGTPEMPRARFSSVHMTLPGYTSTHAAYDPPSRSRRAAWLGAMFLAGALIGGGGVGVAMRSQQSMAAPSATVVGETVRPVDTTAAPVERTATASGDKTAASGEKTAASGEKTAASGEKTSVPEKRAAGATPPAAAARQANPAATTVELAIESRPPGASVTIDGASIGETPRTINVAPGRHELKVQKERYMTTNVTANAPGKVSLDLHRPPATLHVSSTPAAAEVVIAGQSRGRTPLDVKLPGYESYEVRLALAGARPWRKTVYLGRSANRVDATLVVSKPRKR